MSQETVYNLLKKEENWMSTEELSKKLKQGKSSIRLNCKKLEKENEIIVMRTREGGRKIYKYKIKNGKS